MMKPDPLSELLDQRSFVDLRIRATSYTVKTCNGAITGNRLMMNGIKPIHGRKPVLNRIP
jgi:hypothetical protein